MIAILWTNKSQKWKKVLVFCFTCFFFIHLWNGIDIGCSNYEMLFFILRMINIGSIEEIICKGFLFRALEKHVKEKAMCLSSAFLGIVHILNFLSGTQLIPTILKPQSVIYMW